MAAASASCQRTPPSIVLVILDATRADAISAYGHVEGTTPSIDALARAGVVYEHAFANANWSLPSHATLFTGLLPVQHGVREHHHKLDGVPTLAELLRAGGYETVGFNQNPWLTAKQGMTRGFDTFKFCKHASLGPIVERWLATRRADRPFFLFLNIMDAHDPYIVRETNPYLPDDVSVEDARATANDLTDLRCNVTPADRRVRILRGLYLGNVRVADANVGGVLAALQSVKGPLIVIITADHGEHLGEHRLVLHEVGVDSAVTRVPLIVHGVPDAAPARIRAAVQLADLMPTILAWAAVPIPAGLAGEPLPVVEPARPNTRAIFAEFHDGRTNEFFAQLPAGVHEAMDRAWRHCTANDRVFGDMRAVIRFPYELMWYEKHPVQLFDLERDPGEERDLAAAMPGVVAELTADLDQLVASSGTREAPRAELDPAQVERLRALGYLGGKAAGHPGDSR